MDMGVLIPGVCVCVARVGLLALMRHSFLYGNFLVWDCRTEGGALMIRHSSEYCLWLRLTTKWLKKKKQGLAGG